MRQFTKQVSLLSLVGLVGCDVAPPDECDGSARQILETDAALQEVVEGNTGLALELFRELAQPDENFFFSPFSISMALGMTEMGAAGNTASEMKAVLRIPDEESAWHGALGGLGADIGSGLHCDYDLAIANQLFAQQGFPIHEEFLSGVLEAYGAPVESLDFLGETELARVHINDWVSDLTNEKIPDLLKPGILTPDSVMVLVNAIYFKGDWLQPFEESATDEDGVFTQDDGTEVNAAIMRGEIDEARYAELENGQLLELPYSGDELAMVLALPEPGLSLAEFEDLLTAEDMLNWGQQLADTPVFVSLPRFEMRSSASLMESLIALGMVDAFSGVAADFSRMTDPSFGLYISAIVHEAYVKVNEEGTEAAAATAVVASPSSVPDYPTFNAAKPFLFQIQDRLTGSVLFMGRVVDPSAAPE